MRKLGLVGLVSTATVVGASFAGGCGSGGSSADATPATDGGLVADGHVASGPTMVYVGGDDSKIHAFAFNETTLALTPAGSFATGAGSSFLAFDPQRRWLLTVNEGADTVESYAIDAATGALTRRDGSSAGGSGPAYIGLDRSGAWALVASYGDGTAEILPVDAAGNFGTATAMISPGAHAHEMIANLANTIVYVPCLGIDQIATYAFAAGTGTVTAKAPGMSPAGAGPRHMALAADGRHVFVVNELASSVTTFAVGADGTLTAHATLSTLPAGFTGSNSGAELALDASGHHLYVSNRGHDSIATFDVEAEGVLTLTGHTPTGGTMPRHFAIVADGHAMLVANQGTGNITGFRIDVTTGALTSVGELAQVSGAQFVDEIRLP